MSAPVLEQTAMEREWAQTEVHVVAPNEQVFLTMRGDHDFRVTFAPGYLQRATRSQVSVQLGRLARLAFAARTQAFFEARSREAGRRILPGSRPVSRAGQEYAAAMADLTVSGSSPAGEVTVTAVGMRDFDVFLGPGATDLPDERLAAALGQAAQALMADQQTRVRELKADIYHWM